jgi:hypothetical protein
MRILRIDKPRLLQGLYRHFRGAQLQIDFPKRQQCRPAERIVHGRAAEVHKRLRVISLVAVDEPEGAKRRDIVGVPIDERFANRLRPRQLALLAKLLGFVKLLVGRLQRIGGPALLSCPSLQG